MAQRLFKLKQNAISDTILNIITDSVCSRKQRVILNGQASPWASIEAGLPQGSMLGPQGNINVLSEDLPTTAKFFAVDTSSLFSKVYTKH